MNAASSKKFSMILISCVIAGLSTSALAESHWDKTHPRRDEVNDRLANQHRRIHHEVKNGDLTHAQAANLYKEDHGVRQEERDMASQNGGHITKTEKRALNQQENAVSHQIGK